MNNDMRMECPRMAQAHHASMPVDPETIIETARKFLEWADGRHEAKVQIVMHADALRKAQDFKGL